MHSKDDKIPQLEEELEQAREDLFLAHADLNQLRNENIALKNFMQNLYESCELPEDTNLSLEAVLKNLKENIRVFARDHHIQL